MPELFNIAASFTNPIEVSNGPAMFLWMVPIVFIIAFVYKAVKLPDMGTYRYLKASIILAFTILIFYALIAVGLYAIMRIVTG